MNLFQEYDRRNVEMFTVVSLSVFCETGHYF